MHLSAQTNKIVLLHIPKTGRSLAAFIPKGYDTLRTASGDLNKDGEEDVVMVLKDVREDTAGMDSEIEMSDRLLVVLLRTADGWKVAGKTGNLVLCKGCGGVYGDPFAQVKIEKGILVVDFYGGSNWRWANTYKFRYQGNDLYLIGETTSSYFMAYCDDVSDFSSSLFEDINFVTGARTVKQISDDCKVVIDKSDKIKVKPLVRLANVKSGN